MGLETPACVPEDPASLGSVSLPPPQSLLLRVLCQPALQIGELRLGTQVPTGGLGWGRSGPT